MTRTDPGREQQALDWVRRVDDPDFAHWEAHRQWLEADPGNAELFDRISLEMELATLGLAPAGPVPPSPHLANDNEIPSRRWRAGSAAGGVIAASLAALLFWAHSPGMRADDVVVTAPGMTRTVALADGSKVMLNGGSRLRVGGSRSAELIEGEGFFEVSHHPDRPFRLRVGTRVIQDVGTSFDVAITPQLTRIAVRDGAVAIDPGSADVRLTAGQEARIRADGNIARTTVPQDRAIGGWREGRLVYQGASWTEVVTDLSRSLGVSVAVSPDLGARTFTGVIVLDRDKAATIRRFADVVGVAASRNGQGWLLAAR